MRKIILFACVAALAAGVAGAKVKKGVSPVTSGVVIRGQTLPPPPGAPGTKAGANCENFKDEEVNQNGTMTGASVQCGNGLTVQQAIVGLPARFNAYCVVANAGKLPGAARLITSPVPGNANHCDLSGIKPKDAIGLFGGATWR